MGSVTAFFLSLPDGIESKDGVLSNVGVTMFEGCTDGGDERLEKFSCGCTSSGRDELGDEAKGCASNVFVWMLEVVSDSVSREK